MQFIDTYSKIMDTIEKIMKAIVVIVFTAMSIISITEIVRRYLFGLSFQWSGELCRFLLIWLTFIGGSIAFRGNNLVRFDLGHNRLSEKTRIILYIVVEMICLVFIIGIFFRAVSYSFSPVMLKQKSIATGLTMATVYTSVPLGFAVMILFALEKLALLILKVKGNREGEVR